LDPNERLGASLTDEGNQIE